jgi:hypothetical protein
MSVLVTTRSSSRSLLLDHLVGSVLNAMAWPA